MCGILGVRRSWLTDPERVKRALDALAWRGPDGSRLVEAGDWYLGVARLAITDQQSQQPIWSRDGQRLVAFNGAVTSARSELRRLPQLQSGNDAEIPLLRLQEGGGGALTETCGPYALAILDPARDRVWLARDPEGEKPLYLVHRHGELLAFASSVKSLRALGLRFRLSPEDSGRLLRFGFHLGPELQAADLSLEKDLRGAWLFQPDKTPEQVATLLHQPDGAASTLRQRVLNAVARCAEAEVPVALCLSGGVDSSCLAAALGLLSRTLPAYQFQAQGTEDEERARARQVAQAFDLPLVTIDGGAEILQQLPRLTGYVGLPLGDPSILAVHALAQRAAADGIRVLLSGEGADELWLGYRRHRAAAWLPARGLPFPGRNGLGMSTPRRTWRALVSERPYDSLLQVVPPGFAQAVLGAEVGEGVLPQGGGGSSSLERARWLDRNCYLRLDLLPKLDAALMATGIEGRCPYLDPEVLGAAEARAPNPRRILGKRHLRESFAAELPTSVLRGRKYGFGIPLDRWLREDDYLPDLLRESRTRQRSHLRAAGLARMLDLHRQGRCQLGHALYLVAAMEFYLRDLELEEAEELEAEKMQA